MSTLELMNRVRTLLREKEISQASFARRIDVSPQTLSAWFAGRNQPSIDAVAKMCSTLSVSPSWLMTGRADSPEHQSLVCAGCVRIPLLDLRASCGNGIPVDRVAIISLIEVNSSWIQRHCGTANAHALNILMASGDSMSPTLDDGDFVVIDTSVQRVFTDALYAFNLDDDLFIKRIQRQGRGLRIISDNERYEAFSLSPEQLEHGFKIHGRVVTTCLVRKA